MQFVTDEEAERFEQSQVEVARGLSYIFGEIAKRSSKDTEGMIEAVGQLAIQVALLNLTIQAKGEGISGRLLTDA